MKKYFNFLKRKEMAWSPYSWLTNFLTTRKMKSIVEGEQSQETSVGSGVPQGTVRGLIMFLCHIRKWSTGCCHLVRPFICRRLPFIQNHQERKRPKALQADLQNLDVWANKWGMRFNAKKCYTLSINQKRTKFYQLNNHILQGVQNNPYLGLEISNEIEYPY